MIDEEFWVLHGLPLELFEVAAQTGSVASLVGKGIFHPCRVGPHGGILLQHTCAVVGTEDE